MKRGYEGYDFANEERLGETHYSLNCKVVRRYDRMVCVAKRLKTLKEDMTDEQKACHQRELKFVKESKHPLIVQYVDDFIFKD